MFLWCVQEVAELKEEDIISHTAAATQLPTAAATQLPTAIATKLPTQLHTAVATQLPTATAGVSGCLSRTLSELL